MVAFFSSFSSSMHCTPCTLYSIDLFSCGALHSGIHFIIQISSDNYYSVIFKLLVLSSSSSFSLSECNTRFVHCLSSSWLPVSTQTHKLLILSNFLGTSFLYSHYFLIDFLNLFLLIFNYNFIYIFILVCVA